MAKPACTTPLPALEEKGLGKISRLPVSIRIVLESVLRNCDGKKVTDKDVATLAAWNAKSLRRRKFPSSSRASCSRTLLACRCWWISAAMRSAVANLKKDPKDHRAAGAGGSCGRSLGAGGLFRIGRKPCD